MTEPVDVLGMLDRAMPWCSLSVQDDLKQVRAVVAGLIEADKRIDFTPLDHLPDHATCVITVTAGDLRRRAAAIANVSGPDRLIRISGQEPKDNTP